VLGFNAPALEKIFSKKTSVEIRTRFSKRWEHSKISLYTTGPVAGLAGEATISRVIDGHPNTIWEHFGSLTGHSRAEYDAFFGNQSLVQALLLSDVRPFPDIVSLTQLSHLLGIDLPAPKGFLSLENKDGWMSAVVLAAALQGAIKIPALAKSPRENIQTVETFGGGRCNSAVPLAARTHFG
jgi:predicted transcriptional regulator